MKTNCLILAAMAFAGTGAFAETPSQTEGTVQKQPLVQALQETLLNDLELRQVSLAATLDHLSAQKIGDGSRPLNIVVVVDPSKRESFLKETTVTLSLKNIPMDLALRYVAALSGLEMRIDPDAFLLFDDLSRIPNPEGTSAVYVPTPEIMRVLQNPEIAQAVANVREHGKTVDSLGVMREILLAAHASMKRTGRWPASLEELYQDGSLKGQPINPRTGRNPDYEMLAPPAIASAPADKTPVLYELDANGNRDPQGAVGYADGHVKPGKH